MDAPRFDNLTRSLQRPAPRRAALSVLGGSLTALLPRLGQDDVSAKKNRNKPKKTVKFNDFGCVNVGNFCKNNGQCCSGICKGKHGTKKCQAHNVLNCPSWGDTCEEGVDCGTDWAGWCYQTTGQAAFCSSGDGDCAVCQKDADCEPDFGSGAACIVCASCEESGGTACVPPAV